LMAAQFTAHPIEVITRKRKPIHLAELGMDFYLSQKRNQ
jgi:hypothetical protein